MALALLRTSSFKLHKLKAHLLPALDDTQRIVVHLRFWENLSIQEIANFLELSWDETDRLIEKTVCLLRAQFEMIESQGLTTRTTNAA